MTYHGVKLYDDVRWVVREDDVTVVDDWWWRSMWRQTLSVVTCSLVSNAARRLTANIASYTRVAAMRVAPWQ